jgi:hypothetical protein
MKTREIVGYLALALVVTSILANMHDIKRYLRMRSM